MYIFRADFWMAKLEQSPWEGAQESEQGGRQQRALGAVLCIVPFAYRIYCRGSLSVRQGSLYLLYTSKFLLVWLQNIFS